MTERTVTGRFYRVLIDKVNDIWERQSFWKKASDIEFDDGSNLENNRPVGLLRRNTLYEEGAVAYISSAPSWVRLVCTRGGTTNKTVVPINYSTITSVGDVVDDGSARFCAYSVKPESTLSSENDDKIIPSMSLVYKVNSQLTANGKRFYFAYKDGKYGFTLDGDGESFVPFG